MKKILNIMFVIGICLLFQACPKGDDYTQYAFIYKFYDNQDCAEYQSVYKLTDDDYMYSAPSTGYRAVSLHNGYYVGGNLRLSNNGYYTVSHTVYLTILIDEILNGSAPSDWNSNYEKYILTDNPFKEFYVWMQPSTDKKKLSYPISNGCNQYPEGYCIDTTILNKIIDQGQLEDYFYKIK